MSTVFFGSTEFVLPTLEALRERFGLALIVAHPDTPRGRGRRSVEPPAKLFAREHRLHLVQPEAIRDDAFFALLADLKPEFLVVADYGKKIPNRLIELPTIATLNLHPSLLPRHRGAAPVAHTILAGDTETGNTIIGLVEQMDAGPIYAQQKTGLLPGETTGALTARLALLGAELMAETMERLRTEPLRPGEQDPQRATLAPKLTKQSGRMDFSEPVDRLERIVRAMQPWPMAYCTLPSIGDKGAMRINVIRAEAEPASGMPEPGTILSADRTGLRIAAVDGGLNILELQPAGRTAMAVGPFLNGNPVATGGKVNELDG